MITIVFVRHGLKQDVPGLEYEIPLDPAERPVIERLKNELSSRSLVPSLWLASHFAHCWQTADALARGSARTVRLCALTPYSAEKGASLNGILAELDRLWISVPLDDDVIGIVGHEERLSNIARTLLADAGSMRVLERLEAAVIEAETLAELARARGRVVEILAASRPAAGWG